MKVSLVNPFIRFDEDYAVKTDSILCFSEVENETYGTSQRRYFTDPTKIQYANIILNSK
jgi:hypothetical protein